MKKAFIPVFFITASILFSACKRASFSVIDGFTQGSTYHVVYESLPGCGTDVVRKGLEDLYKQVDNSLSIYNDSSVISRINSNVSDETDTLFREVFRLSDVVSKETGGAFDITVGPLVKAWGFGPDALKNFDVAKLPNLLSLVGMDKLILTGNRLVKKSPDMYIDMNAVAQGYTVDLAIDYLKSLGIRDCLVEVGGEVRSVGNKSGEGWKVGIDKPVDGNNDPGQNMEAVMQLNNMALATSGNYRKFYIDNGIKYSHTIDPHTGYPARQSLLSATIIAPECAVADAYATACMVLGTEGAKDLISRHGFLDGYLIWSDEQGNMRTWASKRIRNRIRETGTDLR
jgi:FAD:protein FMN transferase